MRRESWRSRKMPGALESAQTFGSRGPPSDQRSSRDVSQMPIPSRLAVAITSPVVIAALCLCALVTVVSIGRQLPERATRWDFSIYYLSVTLLHEGHDPYSTDFGPLAARLGLEAGEIRHATDPPTFLLLMEPLALMPE